MDAVEIQAPVDKADETAVTGRAHIFDFQQVRRLIAGREVPSSWLPRHRPWHRKPQDNFFPRPLLPRTAA